MNTNNFDSLVGRIQSANEMLQDNARLVINRHVTAKAWLTGYYIVKYEQNGEDRAKYGERLLQNLADRLQDKKAFSYRTLKLYKQFYLTYKALDMQVSSFVLSLSQIRQSVVAQFLPSGNQQITIRQSVIAQLPEVNNTDKDIQTNPELLFNRLSFTHLSHILPIKDPLARTFYETMAIRGIWSVRELQRQIDSNYYVRRGWSCKQEALANLVDGKAEQETLPMDVKSPFVSEFLGLPAKDVIELKKSQSNTYRIVSISK